MKVRLRKSQPTIPPDTLCNFKKRSGGYCGKTAGAGTSHPGQGRCRHHGGAKGADRRIVHGWYSQVEHHRLKEILGRLAGIEMNAMDLVPEANLLRAMTIDYVNRYEEFSEALMEWYKDPETKQRPRRVMDLQDAAYLIESISRVVHRLHQIQSQGAISLDTFRRVTENMGMIVARNVKDALTINKIEKEWQELALDSKEPTAPIIEEGEA